jgi:hypothetical protein
VVDVESAAEPFERKRDHYIARLKPVFLPDDPISDDIIRYFSSLLRVLGMEDRGWDPYAESRAVLNDINSFFKIELPNAHFAESDKTPWRLGLLLYSHIVEMDAPYEVLTNLLRFQLGKGYSPNPFYSLLSGKEQKNFSRRGISTGRKIELIKELSCELRLNAGDIFDDFYDNKLRNAIAHSDYILTEDEFRCRGGSGAMKPFRVSYEKLNGMLLAAKAFIAAFFQMELITRQVWGQRAREAIPYDPRYKGLLEVLVDERDVMCGFKVHWPNNSESVYRRTDDGIEMSNCMLRHETVDLFVGLYAQAPGAFSPLVERDGRPVYTKLENGQVPRWPDEDSELQ